MTKFQKFFKSENFRSFCHTLITDLIWDASVGAAGSRLVGDGDWSRQSWLILGYAVFRTICRVLVKWFKNEFPPEPPLTGDIA